MLGALELFGFGTVERGLSSFYRLFDAAIGAELFGVVIVRASTTEVCGVPMESFRRRGLAAEDFALGLQPMFDVDVRVWRRRSLL